MFKFNYYCQCSCIYCLKPFFVFERLYDVINPDFYLCKKCRQNLIYKPLDIYIGDLVIRSLYQYNNFFSNIFNRYKRGGDLMFAKWLKSQHAIPFYYQQIQIPSSIETIQQRGFNHLKLIYPKSIEVFYKNSKSFQKESTLLQRKKIHFELINNVKSTNKLCLVDDVVTTGSSLLEAKRLLPNIKRCYVICHHSLLLKQYKYKLLKSLF